MGERVAAPLAWLVAFATRVASQRAAFTVRTYGGHPPAPQVNNNGIGFVSLTEAIDTTTPAGRLLFGIMPSLAQFERDLIRERTHARLAAARARGRTGGRPPIMTAEKLDVARRTLAGGKPKSLIAKTIGVSRPTLYAHLPASPAEATS